MKIIVNKPKFESTEQKQKRPSFWGINANPGNKLSIFLMLLPFVIMAAAYLHFSSARLAENADDKLLPSVIQMKDAIVQYAFEKDKRTEEYTLWQDTISSLRRLFMGVGLATIVGLLLGMNMGLFKGMDKTLSPFVRFVSIIPPLAVLPIIFISFGVDELAKVMLIFIGTFPMITRAMYEDTMKIPVEQKTKALTLGAGQLQLTYKIVLPQILPRLIDTVRLGFGGAWLFLISAEAIASTDGLGYRIFLVRRYLAMDVIIPYTLWITLLGFTIDYCLRKLIERKFRWYAEQK